MIESRRGPRGRTVADVALLGKPYRRMIGVVRIGEVRQMAGNAGSIGDVVIPGAVALTALQIGMGPGQRPSRARMIERGRSPICGRMTQLALLRETDRHMVRIVGCCVVRTVAPVARGRKRRVVVVLMAVDARHRRMRAGKRERGVVVVEGGRRPGRRAVTNLALLREVH